MTAIFADIKEGMRLRVLPSAAKCLEAGEVLIVREWDAKLCVHCFYGAHYLQAQKNGELKDFENVG